MIFTVFSCFSLKCIVENDSFVSCSPRLASHIDILHWPVETGKWEGKITQQIKLFFHIHQGLFMKNESERDVHHDHYSLFRQG
jgi:hypothetical protein